MKNIIYVLLIGLLSQSQLYSQDPNLIIEQLEGAKPWSSLELNNQPGKFQFAIVTDRTGGHRPGIFMDGVRKLNLLQPEFVLSVGDLIEGYTEDLVELNRQWDEFNGFIDSLTMPFFYVPGNHDITNAVMEKLYLEKFGKTYYHFVYKDVLFMCMNSEDQYRGAGRGTISDEQYEYIKTTLEANQDVKWTLLFMHQPLWTQENPERWPDVEKLLADRKHTVFTGHVHHYAKYDRNNNKYFTLGTTGGGSPLRGPQLGEFDHVTWITMTDDGPIMANLQLEGIWDENVSTEKTREYALDIWRNNPIQIEPLFVDSDNFSEGMVKLKITNDKDIPMMVKLQEGFSWDLIGTVDKNEIEVAPNSVEFVELTLMAKNGPKSIEDLKPVQLKLEVRHIDDGLPALDIPSNFYIAPEKKYKLEKVSTSVKIDGMVGEWSDMPYSIVGKKDDVSAKFDIAYDDQYVYIAAMVSDDKIHTDTTSAVWNQDFVGFVLNADPMQKSALDNGAGWYRNSLFFLQTPATDELPSTNNMEDMELEGLQTACRAIDGGYQMETAIPISYLKEKQGDNWRTIRLNMVVQDKDQGEVETPRYTFKPDWRGKENRVGSGMFFRDGVEVKE